MTKTVYYTATTIDGFIADADHSLQWLFDAAEGSQANDRIPGFQATIGAMVMGSHTYEWVLDEGGIAADPKLWQTYHGDTPTWVMTTRNLGPLPGAPITFSSDLVTAHAAMVEAAAGKDVWVMGGGDLAGQFADAGLLDEIQLSIAPAFLGGGAPLLPRRLGHDRLTLTAVEGDDRFAYLTYAVGAPV